MKILLICLVISILIIPSLFANEISERQSQLDHIKTELESKRAQSDSLRQKEKSEANRLRDLEEQVSLSGQLLLKIKRESAALGTSIKSQKVQLSITQIQMEKRKIILSQRLRYIYKMGNRADWMEIISSGDPTQALVAYKNMGALAQYDTRLLETYRSMSLSLKTGLIKYENDATLLSRLQMDQEDELAKREKTLKTRKKLIEGLKNDKGEVEKSITQLEEDGKQISGIIEDLEAKSGEGAVEFGLPGLDDDKGNLIWPVHGKIIRAFGLSTDKRGIKLSNSGIDIQSQLGTDVMAAAQGKVIYTSWLRGYGQFVIVDHGRGYYTLYANLSEIMVETGDSVKAGEVIGLVGDSGSLEGAKLHFELRHKKEQLDPSEWLR
jgi:septal ring factor EnvC (AmiA/AmiB activator)